MAVDRINYEALDEVLDQLDIRAKQQHSGEVSDDYWVCKRRFPRHPFRLDCTIYFFPLGSATVTELRARTRNLSRGGVGLLTRRVFTIGDAIEVKIDAKGRPTMYMAGLVGFCRYVGRGYHEVGVDLRVASGEPIFSANPGFALELYDWIQINCGPM